jgi:membrane-bound metal-dependent hydrolase YbcI (DUF457 family)
VQFVSAVFNLRLLNPRKQWKQIIPYFCPMQKISRLQFEFVALMASLMSGWHWQSIPYCRLWILGVTIGTTEVVDNITNYNDLPWVWPSSFGPFRFLVENQSCTWVCLFIIVLYITTYKSRSHGYRKNFARIRL